MKKRIPGFNEEYSNLVIGGLLSVGFILILILIVSFIQFFDLELLKLVEKTSNAFNGLTAPFIGTLVAILTFMAFIVQYQANENQRNDIKIERFENKFYEMLHLHRENLNDIKIEDVYIGRKCFEIQYIEFKCLYKLLDNILEEYELSIQDRKSLEYWVTSISYYHFYTGVNSGTIPISKKEFEIKFETSFLQKVNAIINEYDYWRIKLIEENKLVKDYPFQNDFLFRNNTSFCYKPFQGYVSELGHYYRHLYQTFKLATTNNVLTYSSNPKKEFESRYQYVKLARVQLSNFEQLMIYYNSYFTSGKIWWIDKDFKNPWNEPLSYFIDFAIIKNLPIKYTKGIGYDPVLLFRAHLIKRAKDKFHTEKKLEDLFEQIGG